jgi:hypothetical protein
MGTSLPFRLIAWAAWQPESELLLRSAPAANPAKLPASLRRRVTPLGRKALEAAWAVLPLPGDGPSPRLVFCSRHGEYERTFAVLDALAADGSVSPAEFSLSVHHALAGLLSIATGNRAGHSAIAAGPDTFGYGVLEAVSCLAEDSAPVVVVYFDEPLPDAYAPVSDGDCEALVMALLLAPAEAGTGDAMALEIVPLEAGAAVASRPLALDVLDFLQSDRGDMECLGDSLIWRWRRAA